VVFFFNFYKNSSPLYKAQISKASSLIFNLKSPKTETQVRPEPEKFRPDPDTSIMVGKFGTKYIVSFVT
jgi:hypothetical protein